MQAIAFLTSALELPGPEPDRLELVQRAGAIAEEAGRHEQAVGLFERAITGWQALGDRTRAARAGAAAADAALLLGRDRVRAILDRAFVDFGAPDPGDRGWLELRAIEARSLLRAFQPRASIDVMEEMLPDVERLGDLRFALHCFETYAHALHELGRPIHSLLIHEGVLRHAMELGEMALVERVKINLAVLRMEDDPAVAHELNTAGFDDALRRGSLSIAAFFAGNAGEVEARLGDWETARGRLGRLLEFQPEAFDREMILSSIVIFDAMQGVVDPAIRAELVGSVLELGVRMWEALAAGDGAVLASLAIEIADEDSLNAAPNYLLAAVGSAMAGDVAIARRAADSSVALGRHGRWVEALTQATVAVADALEGRRDQGVAAGRAAIEALVELGVRFDAAEIAFGMARALPRDDPERAWFADFARDVFRDTATVLLPYLDDAPVTAPRATADPRAPSLEAS